MFCVIIMLLFSFLVLKKFYEGAWSFLFKGGMEVERGGGGGGGSYGGPGQNRL